MKKLRAGPGPRPAPVAPAGTADNGPSLTPGGAAGDSAEPDELSAVEVLSDHLPGTLEAQLERLEDLQPRPSE
jgi:hypothetical protein